MRRRRQLGSDPVESLFDTAALDLRTGRFERSLSALTAAGAVITTAEIYLSHDGASFGNKMHPAYPVLGFVKVKWIPSQLVRNLLHI